MRGLYGSMEDHIGPVLAPWSGPLIDVPLLDGPQFCK